ncbi:uncharacterized protein DNG_05868 [Cephalotrichum gorgonifer]|uniref:Uncharacterized protein n=1 Tax=Cephalotrichum gorgonifer TaxID=2041049 RepID=A0AAE8MYL5_9PEZI|nr:uncharacterized protein DNG_05868 [Cephalotrichum gorgonifer]
MLQEDSNDTANTRLKTLYAYCMASQYDAISYDRATSTHKQQGKMAEQEIAEAMRLMSSMPQNDITTILHTPFKSPAPPVSARAVARFTSQWNSPEARLQRL